MDIMLKFRYVDGQYLGFVGYSNFGGGKRPKTAANAIQKRLNFLKTQNIAERKPVDLQTSVANDYFKHKKKNRITW